MEALLLPSLTRLLRAKAPGIRLVVSQVQFRTVEEALLSNRVEMAVSVADALPRSIQRRPLVEARAQRGFVCLYDPRFAKLPKRLTEHAYFQHEHVVVSYAGDVRGVVEDSLGRDRNARVAVSALSHVTDVVDGSALLATVPYSFGKHVTETRRHLRTTPLPFEIERASLELLWSNVTDADAVSRFVRGLIIEAASVLK
jgi:LysR family transcriptional activator of mexEF-oprN operon